MSVWQIGLNAKSGLYEVHIEGCKHTNLKSYEWGSAHYEAATGAAAAAAFEAGNEGCATRIAPCAK